MSGLSGFLTLEANGTQIVVASRGRSDPTHLEFTEFRMGMSSGREGSSGEATARRVVHPAWCKMWVSGAFPLLMQAQIQNYVCKGTYQFVGPAPRGRGKVPTWSIDFDNGRINRIELVSDSDPTTPDYIELEIVADRWDFNHDTAGTMAAHTWRAGG